ncbi:hypothetical protein [Burkholderia stagnalis]|uniref:Uncharacterized protein n=1 Tax=Burkholderia stagnalis TaxID=1503054 RepID=A0A108GG17_9BURK|nr:hypothetical protein [Burkholderia stagnalis]KVZ03377.1 hypothetical protein WT35_28200 [Burkholderia stagnalis]KWA48384.1 hypothetical protein WT43_32510 [Burkholderia stagnalis]KWA51711.1 hypothetical protein WT42_16670 [Burkholderia stagnalis]KWA62692.1 hypothetical protein WT44_13770 [Burkholderia stagnalis]KWC98331.1 hypothetical protein WT46_23755 [Burkholderia stagnalis]
MSDSNFPGLDRLIEMLERTTKRAVVVGYPAATGAEQHPGSDITNAQLAARLSFGDPENGLEARPFIPQGIENGQKQIQDVLAHGLRRAARGDGSVDSAYEAAGLAAVAAVQREVRKGNFAPNKPETIARKGSSRPLIDEGNLIQSTTSEVRDARSQ